MTQFNSLVRPLVALAVGGAILVVGLSAHVAEAGFNGKTVKMTEYEAAVPAGPPIGIIGDFGSAVVGPGNEAFASTGWTVDISDTQILLTNNSSSFAFGSANPFFGDAFFDVLSAIEPIGGASLVGTNISGMNASRITFDADHVYVNCANLAIDPPGQFVRVGVTFVPEPATLLLLTLGVAAICGRVRPSRRSNS
jgi:hypothetical protein